MANYYVSMQAGADGNHEVHTGSCSNFPDFEDTLALGQFSHIEFATAEARKIFPKATACEICTQVKQVAGVA